MKKQGTRKYKPTAADKQIVELAQIAVIPGAPYDPRGLLNLYISARNTHDAKRLVNYGIDVNECIYGVSFLQSAAITGNLELTKFMIEHGGDPNQVGEEGTALHCAARHGHEHIYEYLKPLTKSEHYYLAERYLTDASRSPEEKHAISRLVHTARFCQFSAGKKLLDRDIDVNASTLPHGHSTLHEACKGGDKKIVEILLKAGADQNAKTYDGVTPLAMVTNDDVCKILLKAGAKVDIPDDRGLTPLMNAIDSAVFDRLVKAGSNMRAIDKKGYGAILNIAFSAQIRKAVSFPKRLKIDATFDKGLATIFRKLIKAGVSVNQQFSKSGLTALMIASELDLNETVKVLLKSGADPSVKDSNGKSAEDYAKQKSPIRRLLRGAKDKLNG
jgi:ankyrin repeat protein